MGRPTNAGTAQDIDGRTQQVNSSCRTIARHQARTIYFVPFLFSFWYRRETPPVASRPSFPPPVRPGSRRARAATIAKGGMIYRKGELSKGTMDRNWPCQVALPVYRCLGHNYLTIRFFCEGEGLL